jgi:hypothetical protein
MEAVSSSETSFSLNQVIHSVLQIVKTGSEIHPTSYPMGTGGSIPGGKEPGREVDHSPPTSAEVQKIWIYTSTSIRLHGVVLN